MNPVHVIAKKRDGLVLTLDEIAAFVSGFTSGTIPDYQMSSLAMAIYLRGMNAEETAALTEQMLASGTQLAWHPGYSIVDKHSTGGVGDKVSLVLAPLLACCELRVPMISGRGLGPTGGTLDKLESIPGFRTALTLAEIQSITERVGCVITGASAEIAPADRKLYALRDVTATVASIPLITASIMSKKLAEGLDALVLDVKIGSGAFMKTREQATELAESLVRTGKRTGLHTTALLTDMDQPLGRMIGNAIEVDEAVDALSGNGPEDLVELTLRLGAELLLAAGKASDIKNAASNLRQHVNSGAASEKLREMVAAQGGDLDAPRARAPAHIIAAPRAGFVHTIDVKALGYAVIDLGGGRRKMSDTIDHSVGLEMLVRVGDAVTSGQPLVRVFAPLEKLPEVKTSIANSMTIRERQTQRRPLILDRIRGDDLP
ncbi:MAG: thymidine phosphorylase [Planctomycetaceae bacterium]|nr:thymidine phosphorylase [Planctomycetaceae bacterium]